MRVKVANTWSLPNAAFEDLFERYLHIPIKQEYLVYFQSSLHVGDNVNIVCWNGEHGVDKNIVCWNGVDKNILVQGAGAETVDPTD